MVYIGKVCYIRNTGLSYTVYTAWYILGRCVTFVILGLAILYIQHGIYWEGVLHS